MEDNYDYNEEEEGEEALWKVERARAKKAGDKTAHERLVIPDKRKLRNLVQYRNLSDEDFEEAVAKKAAGVLPNREFEERIQRKIAQFTQDYDIEDLNSNDKLVLRALAQAMISLEDFEIQAYATRAEGVSLDNIQVVEKLNKIMSDLRSDISKLQDDLKITRRVRKTDKDVNVINYLEDLKTKAKEFYKEKMSYIFCPTCNMLLGTIWTLYPEDKKNKVILYCNRKLEDGGICGTKVIVGTQEMLDNKGSNKVEVLPESMR